MGVLLNERSAGASPRAGYSGAGAEGSISFAALSQQLPTCVDLPMACRWRPSAGSWTLSATRRCRLRWPEAVAAHGAAAS